MSRAPPTLRWEAACPPRASGWAPGTHLVTVVDVGVGELPRHELVQDDAVGVDVGLEAERVVVLHPDHLWGLRDQMRPSLSGSGLPRGWVCLYCPQKAPRRLIPKGSHAQHP